MEANRTYRTSQAARDLGVSVEYLRKREERGFFSSASYYTGRDIARLCRRTNSSARG